MHIQHDIKMEKKNVYNEVDTTYGFILSERTAKKKLLPHICTHVDRKYRKRECI